MEFDSEKTPFSQCERASKFLFYFNFSSGKGKKPLSEPLNQTIYWVLPKDKIGSGLKLTGYFNACGLFFPHVSFYLPTLKTWKSFEQFSFYLPQTT